MRKMQHSWAEKADFISVDTERWRLSNQGVLMEKKVSKWNTMWGGVGERGGERERMRGIAGERCTHTVCVSSLESDDAHSDRAAVMWRDQVWGLAMSEFRSRVRCRRAGVRAAAALIGLLHRSRKRCERRRLTETDGQWWVNGIVGHVCVCVWCVYCMCYPAVYCMCYQFGGFWHKVFTGNWNSRGTCTWRRPSLLVCASLVYGVLGAF